MSTNLDANGYKTRWKDCRVNRYAGYLPNMTDYHMHEYYEMSIIISGKVKVLLPDTVHDGTESLIVLTAPMTSHLVVCEPQMLYKRINILFPYDFLAEYVPEWKQLLSVFGKNGRVIILNEKQLNDFIAIAEEFEGDNDVFRKRLLLMLLLSRISDIAGGEGEVIEEPPAFVTEALLYIQENYSQKILANDLAWRLGVGRTTLMTAFKKYTGSTINGFITDCRLKNAIRLMRQGETQHTVALTCGFGDACNMIRAFKNRFGVTPGKYMDSLKNQQQ